MIIQVVSDEIISIGYERRASDIYLIPQADHYQLFIRVAGKREFVHRRSLHETENLISYLKYKARMNISENRRPQGGTLDYALNQEHIQLRLSSIGTYLHRESLVIRLLYPMANQLNFFIPEQFQTLQSLLRQRGLFVFSGPTGSGKTTTMYALAKQLAQEETVVAIEDPVEIHVPEILQLQVNENAQMSYLELLSGILRHRPDTLIIGEIRDAKTAQAAVTAALSGHLVFTTVHARSSGGVIERLMDLGISQVMLQNTLTTVCYQRLMPDINQRVAVMCDLLQDKLLTQQVQHPKQYFSQWQGNLRLIFQQGLIDQETYQKFKAG